MEQTKLESLFEALVNIAIGAGVSLIGQLVFFPMVGLQVSIHQNLTLMALFTVLSVVRSYYVRRLFNKWSPKEAFHNYLERRKLKNG